MTNAARAKRPSSRAPAKEPALSQDAIVSCALELTQREGAAALTLRRIGQELGVDATAFYRHFRDKDELVLACMDRIIETSYEHIEAKVAGADWRTIVSEVAWESWRMCAAYPAIYSIAFARTTGGPGERRMVELLLSSLSELGLGPEHTVRLYRFFVDSVLAMCGMRAAILGLPMELQEKDATAWSRIYAVLPQVSYPATRAHADELAAITEDSIFTTLVEAVLKSIETSASSPASG
jgi:AcrR family transcriptional regulator